MPVSFADLSQDEVVVFLCIYMSFLSWYKKDQTVCVTLQRTNAIIISFDTKLSGKTLAMAAQNLTVCLRCNCTTHQLSDEYGTSACMCIS